MSFRYNNCQTSRSRTVRGFTLTEFAAVFVLVFVLALIFLPMYARRNGSSDKAWQTRCASNEKQIALGMLMYAQDYDGRFPLAGSTENVGGKPQPVAWGVTKTATGGVRGGLIFPYIKAPQVFRCPIAPKNAAQSYRYNDLITGMKNTDLAADSQTILLGEGDDLLYNVGHSPGMAAAMPLSDATINAKGSVVAGKGSSVSLTALTRHPGGANYVFADGHFKWLRPESVFFPPQSSASRVCVDLKTKTPLGPTPGGVMTFAGKKYVGTFHIR